MQFDKIFDISLIYATFRSATPIIYAALCAAITQQADILNIGTEGIMLTGAFTAVTVSYLTGSWVLGILISMVAGLLIAMIMAVGFVPSVWVLICLPLPLRSSCLIACLE